MFRSMDFSFLFDPTRKLFSIGFRVREGALDPSYYDLLASEARLASFLAIAKGDVAPDHWFRLGRALTPYDMPAVRAIVRAAAKDGNRFSSFIFGVVNSAAFQMAQPKPAAVPAPVSTR